MIKLVASAMLALAAMASVGGSSLVSTERAVVPHDSESYVSPARAWVDPAIIGPGGRSVITFTPDFFTPSEVVTADITGTRAGSARVFSTDTPVDGSALLSRPDGSMTAVFIAPQRGDGPYVITFSGSRNYVAVVTVVGDAPDLSAATRSPPVLPGHVPPLTGVAPPGVQQEGSESGSTSIHEPPASPDREGRVDLPSTLPQAPAWPRLEEVPWSILLLAAIALVVTTVAATLLIAARRRG